MFRTSSADHIKKRIIAWDADSSTLITQLEEYGIDPLQYFTDEEKKALTTPSKIMREFYTSKKITSLFPAAPTLANDTAAKLNAVPGFQDITPDDVAKNSPHIREKIQNITAMQDASYRVDQQAFRFKYKKATIILDENNIIPITDFDISKILVGGQFGETHQCRYIGDNLKMKSLCKAVDIGGGKYDYWIVIKSSKNKASEKEALTFKKECSYANELSRDTDDNCSYNRASGAELQINGASTSTPILLSQLETYETSSKNNLGIPLPVCDNLKSYLQKLIKAEQPIDEILLIAVSALQSLQQSIHAMHEKGFLHLDVKLDNAFVSRVTDDGIEVRLGDFGLSHKIGTDFSSRPVVPQFADSNRLDNHPTQQSDFHAFQHQFLMAALLMLGVDPMTDSHKWKIIYGEDDTGSSTRLHAFKKLCEENGVAYNSAQLSVHQEKMLSFLKEDLDDDSLHLIHFILSFSDFILSTSTDPTERKIALEKSVTNFLTKKASLENFEENAFSDPTKKHTEEMQLILSWLDKTEVKKKAEEMPPPTERIGSYVISADARSSDSDDDSFEDKEGRKNTP